MLKSYVSHLNSTSLSLGIKLLTFEFSFCAIYKLKGNKEILDEIHT